MLPWNFSIFTNDLFILRFKNWSIFMDDLPFCNFKRNFYKRSCFLENGLFSWVNCPFWNKKIGLFLWATYPFAIPKETSASAHASLKMIHFHGRIAHFEIKKTRLFSSATYPFQIPKRTSTSIHASLKLVYFHKRSDHFEIQKLVYFLERFALFKFQKGLQ